MKSPSTCATPAVRDAVVDIMLHWLRRGIAGWRLDVIDELPAAFSQAFFAELKKTNPDAVMIGEVWEDASHKVAYGVFGCGKIRVRDKSFHKKSSFKVRLGLPFSVST